MKKYSFLLLFLALWTLSCKEKVATDYATLSGKITNHLGNDGQLAVHDGYHKTIKINADGTFSDTFHLSDTGMVMSFSDGNERTEIFIKNGYDLNLTLNTDEFDETIKYTGTGAENNNYLAQRSLLKEDLLYNSNLFDLEEDELKSKLDLAVADLEALAKLAHSHNIPLIVDSTLTSPALMRPLEFGADIVIHSVSKVMNASGMSIAGAIVAKHNLISKHLSDEAKANFAHYVKLLPARDFGPSLSPFSAIMILNDLRSLRSRVKQMSETALQVATALEANPNIEAVHYPGLASNQSHKIAKKYMRLVDSDEHNYGYLMGFRVKGGVEPTRRVFDKFKMIWRATDLGRAKTVATIPAISTHQQQGEEGRELANIPGNLIRLSIGLEHAQDIIADLEQALGA